MSWWIRTERCDPPHKVARPDQVVMLANQFAAAGWNPDAPALVGYEFEGRIQLLSGSHRYAAAVLAGLKRLPVVLVPYKTVDDAWGRDMDAWKRIMSPGSAGVETFYSQWGH